ncbi:MAG: hypothetical protein VB062_01305 [Christensenella sp.]|nr:hypothetical protein [Christensenella sp.]
MVFGVKETNAKVDYGERPRINFDNKEEALKEKEEPLRFYSVTTYDEKTGHRRFAAEVNAETGIVYSVEMDRRYLPELTAEQKKQTDTMSLLDDAAMTAFKTEQENGKAAAEGAVSAFFQPKTPILGTIQGSIYSDDLLLPVVEMDYYVVLQDGTIYYVIIAWPYRKVVSVSNWIETNTFGG